MTSDQSAREAAASLIRTRLGLPATPSDWTQDQRNTYNKALAAYIQQNPELFNEQSLVTAEVVSKKTYEELADTSFDFSMFADEFGNQAMQLGESVASVGEGVKSALSLTKWLLPVGAVVGVVILLLALARRTGASR